MPKRNNTIDDTKRPDALTRDAIALDTQALAHYRRLLADATDEPTRRIARAEIADLAPRLERLNAALARYEAAQGRQA